MESQHFSVSVGANGLASLVALGPWTADFSRAARDAKVRSITLNAYNGWSGSGIEFLEELPLLEDLTIVAGRTLDISPIYRLIGLKRLALAGEIKGPVHFDRLASVTELSLANWSERKFAEVFHCVQLTTLRLSNYSSPDLTRLSRLVNLRNLALLGGGLRSLAGISTLRLLERLSLQMLNKLESIEDLRALPELLVLWIERAKRLADLSSIGDIPKLRTLVLTDVPTVESVSALSRSQSIESVCLMQSTSVRDGSLAFLNQLPTIKHVAFLDRRHYDAQQREFPRLANPFY